MAVFNVIEFNGLSSRNWVVYRFPGNEFAFGSRLIVKEGQIAVFLKSGVIHDFFTPGTYTLDSDNLPLLQKFINLPFGGKTPFTAEVFYINKTVKLDVFWGTTDPVPLVDPKYNIRIRIRAFGQMGIRISDFRVFFTELIGALDDSNVVRYDSVISYFKGIIVMKVKTNISSIIIAQKVSALEIAPMLEELSLSLKDKISNDFDRFGVSVVNFIIDSINFPDEDFDKINDILAKKAHFDIIGDERYRVGRTFDVMESAANNEGAGGLAAAGIGIGLGAGAGQSIASRFSDSLGSNEKIKCSGCGFMSSPSVKYCSECGKSMEIIRNVCFKCESKVDKDQKFCNNCGASQEAKKCQQCNNLNSPGVKFCSECGVNLEG